MTITRKAAQIGCTFPYSDGAGLRALCALSHPLRSPLKEVRYYLHFICVEPKTWYIPLCHSDSDGESGNVVLGHATDLGTCLS